MCLFIQYLFCFNFTFIKSTNYNFEFYDKKLDYINKIKIIRDKTIQANCKIKSNYSLTCYVIFKDKGKYYLTINAIYYTESIIM